jgi:hypothetical protein
MVSELWTPPGATGYSASSAGSNTETGEQIEAHIFRVKDPVTGRQNKFCILADGTTSQAHLEDMAAASVDNWLTEVRAENRKPAPTPEQRKEIGRILNDIRTHRMKRKQSSNGRIYYKGGRK